MSCRQSALLRSLIHESRYIELSNAAGLLAALVLITCVGGRPCRCTAGMACGSSSTSRAAVSNDISLTGITRQLPYLSSSWQLLVWPWPNRWNIILTVRGESALIKAVKSRTDLDAWQRYFCAIITTLLLLLADDTRKPLLGRPMNAQRSYILRLNFLASRL